MAMNLKPEIIVKGAASDFPMRLNRFLSISGIASRREADALIEKKKVRVNGAVAELGAKVNLGDAVSVGGAQKASGEFSYIAFHKSAGTLLDPSSKAWAASDLGSISPRVSPADLLEKDASGLVILTNDVRVSRILGQPDLVEREYVVRTQEPAAPTFLKKLESGIELGGRMFKARKVEAFEEKIFSVAISAPRRDVERMCEALHHTALSVRRERIANVSLKGLKPNARREITGKELEGFLKRLDIS